MSLKRVPKESTLQLRLSTQQKEALSHASKLRHMSLSHFVLENAYTAAQEILGEQNHFLLPPEQWDQFCQALDAPIRDLPHLNRLLNEKSILDES